MLHLRGFDFGNHFNEYAGFDCDYTRYPASDAQRLFFRHYMAAQAGSTGSAVSEEVLTQLEAEANVFALASHAYWGVWALIQARYSPIEFDYFEYSGMRWAEYRRRREEFLGAARRMFMRAQ